MAAPELKRIGAAAVFPWSESHAARYTYVSRFDETIHLWRREKDELWLPRGLVRGTAPIDLRAAGIPIDVEDNFVPRSDEQAEVVDASLCLLREGRDHILQAPTGHGKTFVACAVAARLGVRTLVITTKEDIIDQWRAAAKSVMGVDVSVWRGERLPHPAAPMVVGLVQSIMKGPNRYGRAAYQGYGLVLIDEVHRIGAEQFSNAMWWLPARHRLGLSATPYRRDGRERVFFSHIGPVAVTAEMETMIPKVLIHETGWRVPRRMRHGVLQRVEHKPGRTMHINKMLAGDTARNAYIVDFLVRASERGRSTIVFADTMDHLRNLEIMLVGEGVSPSAIGFYVGLQAYDGTKAERQAERDAAKSRPIILATYKMASEATDIPWLDTCVLATPRADVVQIVGRIRREYPDKKQPVVLDLVDRDSHVFRMYAEKRARWYRRLGCPMRRV